MKSTEEILQEYLVKIEALNLATFGDYQARFKTILSEAIIAAIRNEAKKKS